MRARGCLVLGMHRSGTSAVAGALERLGLHASRPDDAVRGPWNPAGHFESRTLMALDDRLLGEMGATWWSPPPAGAAYASAAAGVRTSPRQARAAFRRAYPRRDWVWKDPRASLLLPLWRAALRDRVAAVVVVRNPLDVAASLERRNKTTTAFGVALWERYNRLLLAHAEGLPVLVTRFDDLVADPDGWSSSAADFLVRHGLSARPPQPGGAANGAVDPSLRHSVHGPADLAPWPSALAVLEAMERSVGTSDAFAPPDLGAEPAWVQAELDTLGPDRRPAWRPPPGTAPEGAAQEAPERVAHDAPERNRHF